MEQSQHHIFYSKYCQNCKDFLQELYKTEDLYAKFNKICVDGKKNIPKQITSVPTIIVPQIQKPLVGEEAFFWLDGMKKMVDASRSQPQQPPSMQDGPKNLQGTESMGGVSAFSYELGGFSDTYSTLGADPTPMEHAFSFIGDNKGGKINTPNEAGHHDSREGIKSDMDRQYERMMQQRKNEVPNAPSRI